MVNLWAIAIGAFSGITAGMFGVGGALTATPLLRLFVGLSEVLAVATPLPAAIPAAISGSIAYYRKRMIRFDVAIPALIGAVPFSFLGAYLTNKISGPALMVLTGGMVAYSAWLFVERGWKLRSAAVEAEDGEELHVPPALYLCGALAGFISGFLAIGGGMVLVPSFVKLLRMRTKPAVATSLFCVAVLAVPGTITHALQGNIDWPVALLLTVGVVPTAYIGARLASALKSATLEKTYGVVMLLFSIFFIIRSILAP